MTESIPDRGPDAPCVIISKHDLYICETHRIAHKTIHFNEVIKAS